MSTPEILPSEPRQPEMQPRVEQPIVPEKVQQLGVHTTPQTPKPLVGDNNQVMVTPVPTAVADPATPMLSVPTTIASSEVELEKGAKGPANLSVTWLDMFWLREVGKAISKGWRVIFGQK